MVTWQRGLAKRRHFTCHGLPAVGFNTSLSLSLAPVWRDNREWCSPLSSAFVFSVHSPSFCWLCPCVDSFSLLIYVYRLFLSPYFHFFFDVGGCISFCRAERLKMFLVSNRSTFVLCPLFGKVSKFCPISYTFKDNCWVSLCTILLIHLYLSLPICLLVYIITSS